METPSMIYYDQYIANVISNVLKNHQKTDELELAKLELVDADLELAKLELVDADIWPHIPVEVTRKGKQIDEADAAAGGGY